MERFQARSQELEQKLLSKEQELEQLVQKQKQVCLCLGPGAPGSFSLHPLPAPALFPRIHLGFGFVCLSVFNQRRTI